MRGLRGRLLGGSLATLGRGGTLLSRDLAARGIPSPCSRLFQLDSLQVLLILELLLDVLVTLQQPIAHFINTS